MLTNAMAGANMVSAAWPVLHAKAAWGHCGLTHIWCHKSRSSCKRSTYRDTHGVLPSSTHFYQNLGLYLDLGF